MGSVRKAQLGARCVGKIANASYSLFSDFHGALKCLTRVGGPCRADSHSAGLRDARELRRRPWHLRLLALRLLVLKNVSQQRLGRAPAARLCDTARF